MNSLTVLFKSFTFFFEASIEHQVVAPIIVNCEMLFVFLNTFQKQAFWKILFGGCSYYMSIVKYKMSRKPLKNKSSHSEAFWKKGVLNNFEKLTGQHLYQTPFFVKFQVKDCNFIKKRLQHKHFPVKHATFILQNISSGIKSPQTKSFVANNLLLYNWLIT